MWLLHFAMGASLGLSVDEAHYALYAAHLDWSYFDHPPLVGWVQWPLLALNAPTWVLRLVPEALWLGTALLAYALAERMRASAADMHFAQMVSLPTSLPLPNGTAGLWAVVALSLTPLLHVLGIGLLPDSLLMFLTLATMWITLDLMEPKALTSTRLWLWLGLALGLAGLSKYTAIFAVPAVVLCLLSVHGVGMLSRWRAWLAVVLAMVLVLPVAYWNHANHWISFTYQAKHGAGGGWSGLHFARFLLIQVVVYGPLFLWAVAGARRDILRSHGRTLLAFFVIPFAVLAALSGGGTSLPHWTAPAWAALLPFAGLGLALAQQRGRRWLVGVCMVVQAALIAMFMALMLTGGAPLITHTQAQGNSAAPSNPFADVYGWSEAGERALALAAQHGLHSVSVQNWTLASRIAWYARPLPVQVLEDRFDQFDLWAADLPVGADTLLVDWSQLAYTVPVDPTGQHGFADCQLLDTQSVTRFGNPLATFRFYACHRWSGHPQPKLQDTDEHR